MKISDYVARFRTPAFMHQLADAQSLIDNESFGLLNEMGTGKSKSVIDAACVLHLEDEIDRVVVIAPASVRSVWLNPDFGEIKKHCWRPANAMEFHSKGLRTAHEIEIPGSDERPLPWVVTNYEYIRPRKNRDRLIEIIRKGRTMLVLDESAFIKSPTAVQTKACLELSDLAVRRVILNGTPITHSPLDLWSQMRFLDEKILPYANFYAFRATFAVVDTRYGFPKILRFQNLDRLQRHVAPYVVRREKRDCLDLPEKIYSQIEVPLDAKSWSVYKKMREEAVVWLDENPSLAAQAGVRVLRLAQITSGFLGGFDDDPKVKPIGTEKLDALTERVEAWIEENPKLKLIVWARFRREIESVAKALKKLLPTYVLYGEQSKDDREEAIRVFSGDDVKGPALLAAQPQAGGFGLNLVAASTVVYLSNDFNLGTRLQSEDRVHRPGQSRNVLYFDVIATGPTGQKTVDHTVVKALREKSEIASWTASAWKAALKEE